MRAHRAATVRLRIPLFRHRWVDCGILALALACGETSPEPVRCPTATAPTSGAQLTLGTGVDQFEDLVDGQDLVLARGPQGGCHLWLAFQTVGIDPERVTVTVEILEGEQRRASSQTSVRLMSLNGVCGLAGFAAVLEAPWLLQDREVLIAITAQDESGSRAEDQRTVRVRWPSRVPGEPSETACGPRS